MGGQFYAPGHFALGVHWLWGWVGRTAGIDRFEKKKKKLAPDGNKITFTVAHAQHVA